jgi:hypothetical protein
MRRTAILAFLVGIVAAILLQLGLFALDAWPMAAGEFLGPDSYMRLTRTLACRGGLGCPDGVVPGVNAPFGYILHWPWLVDRILMALAAPFTPLLGFSSGVAVSGYILGPLLEVVAIGLLVLGGKSLLESELALVGLLAAVQLWSMFAFLSGRPDHHGLQVTLFAGFLVLLVRALTSEDGVRSNYLAGIFAGMAFWASTEALVTIPPLLGVPAVLWIAHGERKAAALNRRIAAAVLAILSLGLLVDGPEPNRWSPDFDRFSVVHVTLFALFALSWAGLERLRIPTWPRRLGVLLLAAILTAAILVRLFPGIQGGPMADLPPELWPLWLDHTAEFIPLLESADPIKVIVSLSRLLLALPAAAYLAFKAPRPQRTAWALFVVALVWFGFLTTVVQVRWAYYLLVLYPIPLAWILGTLARRLHRVSIPFLGPTLTVLAVVAVIFGPAVGTTMAFGRSRTPAEVSQPCSARQIVPTLQALSAEGDSRGVILAPIFWGPEILYRTGIGVVATPYYHRKEVGILDSHRIMTASPDRARELVLQRQIRWIVICRKADWLPLVDWREEGTFYQGLQSGTQPPWLTPVTLPDSLAGEYGLWEVEPAEEARIR